MFLCFCTHLCTDILLQVLSDIAHHNIQIFQAPSYENEDEETIAENEEIAVSRTRSVCISERLWHVVLFLGQDPICGGWL